MDENYDSITHHGNSRVGVVLNRQTQDMSRLLRPVASSVHLHVQQDLASRYLHRDLGEDLKIIIIMMIKKNAVV